MEYVRKCNNCYMESPPSSSFCLHCGSHVTVLTPKEALANPRGRQGLRLDRRTGMLLIGAIVVVVLVIATIIL